MLSEKRKTSTLIRHVLRSILGLLTNIYRYILDFLFNYKMMISSYVVLMFFYKSRYIFLN